jgi:hypothetical protein
MFHSQHSESASFAQGYVMDWCGIIRGEREGERGSKRKNIRATAHGEERVAL